MEPSLIHAWDAESVSVLIRGRPSCAVAATLAAVPTTSGATPLAQDRVEAICLGGRARRQAVAAGWLHGRLRLVPPPSLEPDWDDGEPPAFAQGGMSAWRDAADRRNGLRSEWGVDERTVVIGVVGDPPAAIDGWLAFEMAARAALAGHPTAVVVHPSVARADELGRWRVIPRLSRLAIEDERALLPWELFDGFDAVLLPERWPRARTHRWLERAPGSWSGPLSLAWAHRAGLAVVSTRDGPLEGDLDPGALISVPPRANDGAFVFSTLSVRHGERAEAASGASEGASHADDRRVHPGRSAGGTSLCAAIDAWAAEIRNLYRRAATAAGETATLFANDSAASR